MAFVDEVTVWVRAGRGGHGSAAMLREPFKPRGGPEGGDGGRGGDVVFEASSGVRDLSALADRPPPRRGRQARRWEPAHRGERSGSRDPGPGGDGGVRSDRSDRRPRRRRSPGGGRPGRPRRPRERLARVRPQPPAPYRGGGGVG